MKTIAAKEQPRPKTHGRTWTQEQEPKPFGRRTRGSAQEKQSKDTSSWIKAGADSQPVNEIRTGPEKTRNRSTESWRRVEKLRSRRHLQQPLATETENKTNARAKQQLRETEILRCRLQIRNKSKPNARAKQQLRETEILRCRLQIRNKSKQYEIQKGLQSNKIHTITEVTVLPPLFDWELKTRSLFTSNLKNMK
jgi:hypothetical protein